MLSSCFDSSGKLIDEEFNRLVKRFSHCIYAYANKYYLPGGDADDLYQWGLLGLYKAVRRYDENGKYSFDIIAIINIKNMMKSAIKMANREKHKIANRAYSLQYISEYQEKNGNKKELMDKLIVERTEDDPLAKLADKETVERMMKIIDMRLSHNERQIMKLYIIGYKQRHISEKLNVDHKMVDNAIQRAKKKLAIYFPRMR
ncbi:hypothetical protein P22_3123 [Propionispora sp. 2/2-37]|uniref:sigma-70 family RNA polymerase sigma factor n=1 Tax=Propionispora sp. 2/2-37 TaxID=1677858 RepID=UPI0006BB8E2B|nr:sigma-70 family RNA polymerase sigma factor [Propionispora sp. 2/2-37]CUH96997.1 hypothetical protein P22_3123 [Propionispora sp. 2/2-37]